MAQTREKKLIWNSTKDICYGRGDKLEKRPCYTISTYEYAAASRSALSYILI